MTESQQDEIVELQMKVQFQEEALSKLDEVVVRQADLVDRLVRRMEQLEERLEDLRHSKETGSVEKPPHY